MARIRSPLAIGILLLACGLSACATAHKSLSPTVTGVPSATAVSAAMVYQATMRANAADFRYAFTVTPANPGAGVVSTESGDYSWAADEGSFTLRSIDKRNYAITSQYIVDGNQTYSRIIRSSGPLSRLLLLSSGTGWTESTISDQTQVSVPDLLAAGVLDAAAVVLPGWPSGFNPADLLSLLRSEPGTVADLGDETVDGVRTTHYRETIPWSQFGAGSDAEFVAAVLGVPGLTVDYWVDSGDRLRQLRTVVTVARFPQRSPSAPAMATTPSPTPDGTVIAQGSFSFSTEKATGVPWKYPVTAAVTLQLSDYGAGPHLTLPPQSDVGRHESCTSSSEGDSCQGS